MIINTSDLVISMFSIIYREVKHRYRDCNCNHKITDFDSIEFKINDSRIVQCIECDGLMGW